MQEKINLARVYYQSWANQDKKTVKECLAKNFTFYSPQDKFTDPVEFISSCWIYSQGLVKVEFIKEAYNQDQVTLHMLWHGEDGSTFTSTEHVTIRDGKITTIVVENNNS